MTGALPEHPGLALLARRLIGPDIVCVLKGQADIVQTIEQAVLAKRIDLKSDAFAVRANDLLRFQINRQCITFVLRNLAEQLVNNGFVQHDRQHAVLEAVIEKDVSKARRNNGAKAEIFQCPRRMLTAGAGAQSALSGVVGGDHRSRSARSLSRSGTETGKGGLKGTFSIWQRPPTEK